MPMVINTLELLLEYAKSFEGSEREFNRSLLVMLKLNTLDQDVFLEYLEITQVDIVDALEEGLHREIDY